jgi:hypothetical protein
MPQGGKSGSGGQHGGGHKDRQRGANASDRRQVERDKQARIARERGQQDRSGRNRRGRRAHAAEAEAEARAGPDPEAAPALTCGHDESGAHLGRQVRPAVLLTT